MSGTEIGVECAYPLKELSIPPNQAVINFGSEGQVLSDCPIMDWWRKKKEKIKKELEEKGIKNALVDCHIGRYGEDKEPGLKVIISIPCGKTLEDIDKFLIGFDRKSPRILGFATKIKIDRPKNIEIKEKSIIVNC